MKNSAKNLLVVSLAIFGLNAFAAAPVKLNDINVINVTLTLQSQGTFSDNGTVRTYNAPATSRMNTKDLLNQLAVDKYAETNYAKTFFPAGSKLAINSTNGAVVVVNGNNELIVDVSDIVSFSAGTNDIVSGRVSNATGLAQPNTTELVYVSLNFDDTFISPGVVIPGVGSYGNLKFFIVGLDTIKTSDSTPGASGNYRENTSDFVKSGAGEGEISGAQCVVTGSIQGSRGASLTLAVPVAN
jgi:hypothetical protein